MKHVLNSLISHNPHAFHLFFSNPHVFWHRPTGRYNRVVADVFGRIVVFREKLNFITLKRALFGTLLVTTVGSAVMLGLFVNPKNFDYGFASSNCFFNPVLLPDTAKVSRSSDSVSYTQQPKLSIVGYPILSTSSCVDLEKLPKESVEKVVVKSPLLLSKSVSISLDSQPKLQSTTPKDKAVSPNENLKFDIDKEDNTFYYQLSSGEVDADCSMLSKQISCPIEGLNLEQGKTHDITVKRSLGEESESVLSDNVTLLDPVQIVSTSVEPDSAVFENISSIELKTNKPLAEIGTITLKQADSEVKISAEVAENSIVVSADSHLPRGASYVLTVDNAVSDDGSYLSEPYTLPFSTTSGPSVTSTNIGKYEVATTSSVRLSFDVALEPSQELGKYVSITIGNQPIPVSLSLQDNTVTVNPSNNIPACTSFRVNVLSGLTSVHGVGEGSAWSYDSKTLCQQVFSIGRSVNGSSIAAFKFGSGSQTVVFVGGLHGTEKSSTRTLWGWVDELERNSHQIPADKTIVIIPNMNPDGYNATSRTNTNNIDLNRNFPANDWATDVYQPRNVLLPGGGGTSPLTEPESAALASYIQATQPQLVLTYHAVARSVFSNGSGNSASLAASYAGAVGYSSYNSSQEDGIFAYPTTGEFETWLNDKLGIPALLVELSTLGSNEIYNHKSAMWSMVR